MQRTPVAVGFRMGLVASCLFCVMGMDCIERGPFGEEEPDVEDHTFRIELKNTTMVPVAFREVDTASGFIVDGTDSGFIQRSAVPGQIFRWTASLGLFVSEPVECTYQPPSDKTPLRRVEWDGNDLNCHFWEVDPL